jgi:hypothetical protein
MLFTICTRPIHPMRCPNKRTSYTNHSLLLLLQQQLPQSQP